MRRRRYRSKTARIAFFWAVLTTPLSTVPLLYLADEASPLRRLVASLPYASAAALVALFLIGLPVMGIILALTAFQRLKASWTPLEGADLARLGLIISVLSSLAGLAIFIASTR